MCPACLATAGWLVAGAVSATGVTVFATKKFRARKYSGRQNQRIKEPAEANGLNLIEKTKEK